MRFFVAMLMLVASSCTQAPTLMVVASDAECSADDCNVGSMTLRVLGTRATSVEVAIGHDSSVVLGSCKSHNFQVQTKQTCDPEGCRTQIGAQLKEELNGDVISCQASSFEPGEYVLEPLIRVSKCFVDRGGNERCKWAKGAKLDGNPVAATSAILVVRERLGIKND